jgi:Icc protein
MRRILHLSDTHFGGQNPDVPAEPEARLRAVLAATSQRGPFDAVVVSGDVCDAGSEADAVAVRALLVGVAPVVVAVPGNHDESAVVTSAFGEASATLGDWLVVGVATNVPGQVPGDGRPLADAISRLEQEAPHRPAIVIHHHPVHSRSTHEWFTLDSRGSALEALARRSAPLLMLSGHTHEAFETRVGPVHFIGAPSTYYGLAHRDERWGLSVATTGAVVIDVREDAAATRAGLVMA